MLDLSGFLQTVASVLIIFAAFSWVCGKIVEIFHTLTNRHGRRLHVELSRCFGESPPGPFTNYFYWHPLIEPLSQPRILELPGRFGGDGAAAATPPPETAPPRTAARYPDGHLPGHVGAETFAAAMLDPFPWPTTPESLSRMLAANRKAAGSGTEGAVDDGGMDALARELLRQHRRVTAATSWSDLLGERGGEFHEDFLTTPVCVHADWTALDGTPLDRLETSWSVNRLVPDRLRARMLTLMREAEGDIDEFRTAVARWYREAMDRASGRFQRESMLKVFLVALAFSVPLHVNMFDIAEFLRLALAPTSNDPLQWPNDVLLWSLAPAKDAQQLGHNVGGAALAAALAAVGAPFWHDLLDKVSRRSGRGPGSKQT